MGSGKTIMNSGDGFPNDERPSQCQRKFGVHGNAQPPT